MSLHIPPALYHRRFRYLWLGLLVSIAGSQMQTWALFWHIRTLTEQPIALGAIGLARIVPILAFSLIGGAVADAANRRRLLFITQSVMAFSALALAWLTLNGQISLWHIYLLTAVQAAAGAFDAPARQSLVPNLVPARDLSNAFSLSSIAFQTGAILGPALSGLVIAYWDLSYAYLINAVTYGAVILALLVMGPVAQAADPHRVAASRGRSRSAAPAKAISWQAILDGVRFIWSHPIILSTMIIDFFATFFSSANTLMPIFARDVLHVGVVEYGWLSAAQSVGAVSGGADYFTSRPTAPAGAALPGGGAGLWRGDDRLWVVPPVLAGLPVPGVDRGIRLG